MAVLIELIHSYKSWKMGSSTLLKSLSKFGDAAVVAITRRSATCNPKSVQTSAMQEASIVKDAIKQAANEAMVPGENMRDNSNIADKVVSETAEDVSKTVVEAAWNTAKDTIQRAKDAVIENAEESKEYVKANADSVEEAMNTKDRI